MSKHFKCLGQIHSSKKGLGIFIISYNTVINIIRRDMQRSIRTQKIMWLISPGSLPKEFKGKVKDTEDWKKLVKSEDIISGSEYNNVYHVKYTICLRNTMWSGTARELSIFICMYIQWTRESRLNWSCSTISLRIWGLSVG